VVVWGVLYKAGPWQDQTGATQNVGIGRLWQVVVCCHYLDYADCIALPCAWLRLGIAKIVSLRSCALSAAAASKLFIN
jgi:hypothetical protein